MTDLGKYARTIRHLKVWQILGRIFARVKRAVPVPVFREPVVDCQNGLCPERPFLSHSVQNSRSDVLRGRFTFLNEPRELGNPVDWEARGAPLLWKFNLHYFSYLPLLNQSEQAEICHQWIRSNRSGRSVAWHPYPTSLRLTNWCKSSATDGLIRESMIRQAAFLYRNLETYVYGNHLLENARALVLTGRYFGSVGAARKWFEKGMKLLINECETQILRDGGHYERSPMYHCAMLELLLDVYNCIPDLREQRAVMKSVIDRMVDAVVSVSHPDGGIALLKDSTLEIAPGAEDLIEYARSLGMEPTHTRKSLDETGYYIVEYNDFYLIMDMGMVGPPHLLAHAHADLFSFELSIAGTRVVVDTGVFEYEPGEMRDYVRSTRAHNTVCIDDHDQMECWGSFRVGNRSPGIVEVKEVDSIESRFRGRFGGYARMLGDGIIHTRDVNVDSKRRTLRVTDSISGTGMHKVESRIHLHPDVRMDHAGETICLSRGPASCTVTPIDSEFRLESGWYCPEFGRRIENNVIVLGGTVRLPEKLCYEIRYSRRRSS